MLNYLWTIACSHITTQHTGLCTPVRFPWWGTQSYECMGISNPHTLFQCKAAYQRGGRLQSLQPSRCPHFCDSSSCISSCLLHSPSWPVSVPSASCPVPCEWRKAPILADQAALCRTLAFFVGGFPYKRRSIRNISGTGEEVSPCNWSAGHISLPWDNFQAATVFTNAHRNKKKQQVKYQCVLPQLLGSITFQLACVLWGFQVGRISHR